ncbi:DUF1990 domain-containing protein [Streptomyces sp. H10-C2]|uniref:DUF1990 family protein n=1 Tax=unclassified Streptomyces TaxID=2593676 RepID=UPI0024B8A01E|nr:MULTISPECIES: DUF1990 domain-containing protein [unclassified Streptomyces]MDJ0344043.1 DUF1990 domain-containing protein [Streptomyces sp. PH10-H1]MDJ0368581.1 DUF1990 domain-containing protein [Streptomyces sp. H10-C2]
MSSQRSAPFTYAEVGATRHIAGSPPPGYHYFRVRTRLGSGPRLVETAGRAVLEWRMHRAMGVTMDATAPEAAPGVRVVVGLGIGRLRLRAPCEVVWTVRDEERTGFAYGTLAGHPECGEESFIVERLPDGSAWLSVTAFSRSASWYMRASGPLGRALQRAYARRCGRVLRRLAGGDRRPSAAGGRQTS